MLVGFGCYIKHFMLSIFTHNIKVLNCVPCNIHVYGTHNTKKLFLNHISKVASNFCDFIMI